MNKTFLSILIALTIYPAILLAQISEGGLPPSYSTSNLKSAQPVPIIQLQNLQIDELINENYNNGTPFRYSKITSTSLDLKSGLNTQLASGEIWRYTISSDNAKSIKIIFREFDIPQGAKLFLYNKNYSDIYGAFTSRNGTGYFAIADFPGNEVTIEYYEPFDVEFSGKLIIEQIGQAFVDLETAFSEAGSDYVDVNCGEGINWQLEKHAVCKYTFTEDNSGYICTGALINNSENDGTPYFLTANHCISSATPTGSVVAYFNYETKGCGLSVGKSNTLSGATLLATGKNSDYTLLKFKLTPPAKYQPYYAGWDLTDTATYCVGIHHPKGLLKKISVDRDPPVTFNDKISWEGGVSTPAGTHWQVFFDEGVTSGGSSGSPLFNQNKRIIGQLHGGGDTDDYYGKLNYSWTYKTTPYATVKSYLSKKGDLTYLDGYAPDNNSPEAVFATDYSYVCVGSAIPFKNYSVFGATKNHWSFSPSTVTFLENTTADSENPVVSFDEAGSYDVKLVVENNNGKDSITSYGLINAGDIIAISYTIEKRIDSCNTNFDSLIITAEGAPLFNWELDSISNVYFNISPINVKQAVIKKNHDISLDSSITLIGTITGIQDECMDQTNFTVEMLQQSNDNIANAKLIKAGENGPFTNKCATIEENEPIPPVSSTSCVSQTKWCDEYGTGENVVENSLWFYFESPANGKITIEATGMDGQIALYSASSYEAILNGNYVLLAANDDISDTDFNSRIDNAKVRAGSTYWIQFDGSAGGSEGNFNLTLSYSTDNESVTVHNDAPITLYPQPAFDYVIAESNLFEGLSDVRVKLYNSLGELVYTDETDVTQNFVKIDLAGFKLSQGLYFISFIKGNEAFNKRLLIKNE